MEDQTSWRGHSFTLLVFTGIVVLCSIFFILGMLVGRAQGQNIASFAASSKGEAKAAPQEENTPELTFYESVKKPELPSLEPPPPPEIKPAVPDPPKVDKPLPLHAPVNVVNYQIAALKRSGDAEKLLRKMKKRGFRAFILAPAPDDPTPFFRLLVGPFADMVEAAQAKKDLERAGYRPILKK